MGMSTGPVPAAMQLTDVLLACSKPEEVLRKNAEQQLQHALHNHTDEYFKLLAEELADDSKPAVTRQLAATQLKNALYGKSKSSNRDAEQRWLGTSDNVKVRVRELLVLSLQSREEIGRKFAALVFGKLAAIEIPNRSWPKLVPCLLERIENAKNEYSQDTRKAAIQSLGFISEELALLSDEGAYRMNEADTTAILAAIVQGMLDEAREIKLEATKAMLFTILLAEDAFHKQEHRDMLMEIVLRSCIDHNDKEIQMSSLEILTKVFERYYDHMGPYIKVIAEATWQLIESNIEGVDIRAMMVWTQIAEEELNILEENAYAGREIRRCLNFISDAREILIPHLTKKLIDLHQAEDYDSEEYTLKMASQISLKYCAQILRNDVISPVVKFVGTYSQSSNWREREAAILAVGSMMDGPESGSELETMLSGCFDYLYENLSHNVIAVRDTTAWTVATIVKHHMKICNVDVLLERLAIQMDQDVPRVNRHICFAFHVVSEQGYQMNEQLFQKVAAVLLKNAEDESSSAKEQRLQSNAYNALAIMIKKSCNTGLGQNLHMQNANSPVVSMMTVQKITEVILDRLEQALRQKRNDPQCELHGNLCVCLSELVEKFPKEQILQNQALPDRIMTLYVEALDLYAIQNENTHVLPDALMAVGLMIKKLGSNFEPYMQRCVKYFQMGLQNYEDVQTCNMCTALIGNPLANNLRERFLPYSEQLIQLVINNVRQEDVDKKIKLSCICALGDVAMALGGKFAPALPQVGQVLQLAASVQVEDADLDSYDWIEYVNKLRETVLEAYISIAYGLSEGNELHQFKSWVTPILGLISIIVQDSKRSNPNDGGNSSGSMLTTTSPGSSSLVSKDVMKQACNTMGDLINFFQKELCSYLKDAPFLPDLIQYAQNTNDADVLNTLSWLKTGLQKYGA
ncbi:unnamed protein product [Amoebophrya sp. A120]|nr:unnamed protein product [Amoebophrya sp. A120]|eukprot:GSA120T00021333001.1